MEDLERILARIPEEAGKLIIVDGVFSMTGDIAKLARDSATSQKIRSTHHGG